MQISCREVRKELANYMEDDISPELTIAFGKIWKRRIEG